MRNKTARTGLVLLAIALPYASVFLGLYLLRNAWAAIFLYHAGMVALLKLSGEKGLLRSARRGWSAPAAAGAGIVFGAGVLLLILLKDNVFFYPSLINWRYWLNIMFYFNSVLVFLILMP